MMRGIPTLEEFIATRLNAQGTPTPGDEPEREYRPEPRAYKVAAGYVGDPRTELFDGLAYGANARQSFIGPRAPYTPPDSLGRDLDAVSLAILNSAAGGNALKGLFGGGQNGVFQAMPSLTPVISSYRRRAFPETDDQKYGKR